MLCGSGNHTLFVNSTIGEPPLLFALKYCTLPQVTKLLSGLVLMIRLKTPISEVVIPLHVGKLNQMKDYSYVDVILHPGVIERSGKEMAFKLYLCEVAVTHVEEDHKLTISRGYQLENELKYKGEKLRNMAAAAAAASKKAPLFGMPPMPKPGATTTASNSGIVMPEIFARKLGSEASSSSSSNQHALGKGRNDKQTTGKRRPLIEDITMEGAQDHSGGKKGKYSVEYKFDDDTAAKKRAVSVTVKIHLDDVVGVSST